MSFFRTFGKKLFGYRRTIGVVGIGSAGKTVFLTSFISHLRHHNPGLIPLRCEGQSMPSMPAEIVGFREIREGIEDLPFFEYEHVYQNFRHHKHWPEKTTDGAYYRCEFQRTDCGGKKHDLTLIDFPGERFNDVLMMKPGTDFASWSDAMLKRIEQHPICGELARDYLNLLETEQQKKQPDMVSIVREYKLLLARMMQDWSAFITPSVFALDRQGGMPVNVADAETIISGRITGMDGESEFAPLPTQFRFTHADISAVFAEHYQSYRDQVVRPQFNNLRRCDQLLVLVDIPGLLAAHVGRFNDTEYVIGDVMNAITEHKENNMFSRLWEDGMDFFSFDNLKKVAFVATKSDTVHPEQRDKLRRLLKDMVWDRVKQHPELERVLMVVSAIDSTAVDAENRLVGHPVWDAHGSKLPVPEPDTPMMVLNPSPLPEQWPDHWNPDSFVFPEVYPLIPERQNKPPRQHGMSTVLDFVFQ